jgi:beta-lactamase regulating signal transducer with metallopeptidase domain
MTPLLAATLAWLGTFALHGTLALALALLASHLLGRRAPMLQLSLLRWSPLLALLSATAQCVWFGSPFGMFGSSLDATLAMRGTPLPEGVDVALLPTTDSGDLIAVAAAPTPSSLWPSALVLGAAFAAVAGLAWLLRVHRRLANLLADRLPETDPRILAVAAEVARSVGACHSPQLSRSAALATPIAFGWLRPEICLPARAAELPPAPLQALLAHELTHLRCGDPAAMWQFALLQALFPWQLLLLPARRRFAHLVELRCDAAAAELVSPAAVARCLVDVAGWLESAKSGPIVALGMAARPSALRERVEAALHPVVRCGSQRLARASCGPVLVSALTFAAPGLEVPSRTSDLPLPPPPLALASPQSPAAAVVADLLAPLAAEREQLAGEAASLLQRLRAAGGDANLQRLHGAIQERLRRLGELEARLAAVHTKDR